MVPTIIQSGATHILHSTAPHFYNQLEFALFYVFLCNQENKYLGIENVKLMITNESHSYKYSNFHHSDIVKGFIMENQ